MVRGDEESNCFNVWETLDLKVDWKSLRPRGVRALGQNALFIFLSRNFDMLNVDLMSFRYLTSINKVLFGIRATYHYCGLATLGATWS